MVGNVVVIYLGKRICKTPKWHNCCEKVTDLSCISQNAVCTAQFLPQSWVGNVFNDVVEGVVNSRSYLKEATDKHFRKNIVDIARKGWDTAVATLHVLQETYKVGVEVNFHYKHS